MLKKVIKMAVIDTTKIFTLTAIILYLGHYSGYFDFSCGIIVGMFTTKAFWRIWEIRLFGRKRQDMAIRPAAFGDKDTNPRPRGNITMSWGREHGRSLLSMAEIAKQLETNDIVITGTNLESIQQSLFNFGIASKLISNDQGERLIVTRKDNPNI